MQEDGYMARSRIQYLEKLVDDLQKEVDALKGEGAGEWFYDQKKRMIDAYLETTRGPYTCSRCGQQYEDES